MSVDLVAYAAAGITIFTAIVNVSAALSLHRIVRKIEAERRPGA